MGRTVLAVCCAFLLLAAACSSGGNESDSANAPAETPTATPSETPATTTTTSTELPTTTTEATATATSKTTPEPEPAVWTYYEIASGDRAGVVRDIDVNPDGTTWALTEILRGDPEDGYVLSRFEGDEWVTYPGPRLAGGDARLFRGFFGPVDPYLAAGAKGTAWVVEYRQVEDPGSQVVMDLWYFDGSEWTVERDAGEEDFDLSLASDLVDAGGDGVLWIGLPTVIGQSGAIVNEGTVLSYDGQTWNNSEFPDDLCESSCWSLHSSLAGEVRMFTRDGVALLEDGQWTALPRDEEFTSASGWLTPSNLEVVAEDGTMWLVLARSTGVEGEPAFDLTTQIFDGSMWRAWPPGGAPPEWAEAAQLIQAFPYYLAAASDQHLFFANPQAVTWFSEDGTVTRMGSADGLPPGEITEAATAADGTLWIAATRGLARFDPGA